LLSFEKKNIFGVPNYVVEGLEEYDDGFIQSVFDHTIASIRAQTETRDEGHYALKLTGLISTDVMTKMSTAQ